MITEEEYKENRTSVLMGKILFKAISDFAEDERRGRSESVRLLLTDRLKELGYLK